MTHQSRRRPTRNLTRRERRSGTAHSYTTPTSAPTATFRRSYIPEPAPVDYATEYRFIRKDLIRILIWATILIGLMVVLSFLPIADGLGQLLG